VLAPIVRDTRARNNPWLRNRAYRSPVASSGSAGRRRRAPWIITAVIGALALIVGGALVGAGFTMSGSHGSSAPIATPAPSRPAPTSPSPAPTTSAAAVVDPAAPPAARAVIATGTQLVAHTTPNGPVRTTLANPTSFGVPLVLLELGSVPGWYRVSLPVRPNGSTGWVAAADVALRSVPYQITVAQSLHTATLWSNGTKISSFPTAVGAPSTASPNGLFFVDVIIDNSAGNQAYGPWVLGLSGFSDVYQTFGGGDAEVAFHGTDEDASVGTSASHGCFRLHNAEATYLAHTVTLGTPVYVRP
jgi:lipoprotein-anchoring transpeptidase ErfK/SrfK